MSIWGYFRLKNWTKMDILHVMQFEEQSSRCQKWRKLFAENDLYGNFAWFFWFFDLDVSDEQSTRRSKRTIVPPLQYWKNERIDYERRKSGRVDGNDFYPSLPSTLFFFPLFSPFLLLFMSILPPAAMIVQYQQCHKSVSLSQSQFFHHSTVDCAHIKRLNYTMRILDSNWHEF